MTCVNCLDTGRSNQGLSEFLDCTKCGAATERENLNAEFPLATAACGDSLWQAHQRARNIEREASADRIARLTQDVVMARRAYADLKVEMDAFFAQKDKA